MKAISRRISRLEKKLAPQTDSPGPSMVEILRERRRRRLEAEGERLEEPPPMPIPVGAGRSRSVVEILNYGRRLAYERKLAALLPQSDARG